MSPVVKKLMAKATAAYNKNRYKSAMDLAKKVLAVDAQNEAALFYVAHGLYFAGQFRRSILYWKRLQQICPSEPNLHLNMGACFDDLGESSPAIRNYKKELELNPISVKALYNLGALYFRAHKYKPAAAYLERSFSQNNTVSACVWRLAHSYFKTGESEKEQILYEDWLWSHPNDTWALNNLGSHLMGQGQYSRALLRLKKAAQIDPADKLVAKNIQKAERERQKMQCSTTN